MTVALFIIFMEKIIDNKLNFREKNILKKIDTIKKKYRYYKYLYSQDDKEMIKYFIYVQKIFLNIIKLKNINRILSKKYILFNNYNLELDNFKGNHFNMYIDKIEYKFDFNDFKNLIINSLFNYELYNTTHIIIKPRNIKNPYTNIEISRNNLYNFYFFCKKNRYTIPSIYLLYYKEDFNIKQLFCNHEIYIVKKSLINCIKNLSNSDKFDYLMLMINEYTEFIIKYLKNFSIRFLLYNYKTQFYNISLEKINYYNNFLRDYLLCNYLLDNNYIKQFIDLKIKNIIKLLYDNNINLITSNHNYIDTIDNIDNILNLLNENIYYIIRKILI